MRNTLVFSSFDDFERWTEQFDECSEWEQVPTAIDDGWRVSVDLFTECKSFKTALRRFKKAFESVNKEIEGWVECMRECCEEGYFQDTTGWKPAWTSDPEEIRKFQKGGTYSWGVEENTKGYWYIFLNISGAYAGRERTA